MGNSINQNCKTGFSTASLVFATDNVPNWLIGQGIYENDDKFKIVRNSPTGLTTSFAIDKTTGYIGVGSNYTGYALGIFKSAMIIPHQKDYLTVTDSASTGQRTYLASKQFNSNGEVTNFNGTKVEEKQYAGNITIKHYLPDEGRPAITQGFNSSDGYYVTDIGSASKIMKLKTSGVFTKGVSGYYYASTSRPQDAEIGAMIFDTTLQKPIWYNGNNWVDANGTEM